VAVFVVRGGKKEVRKSRGGASKKEEKRRKYLLSLSFAPLWSIFFFHPQRW
jgi:hypothetical protein